MSIRVGIKFCGNCNPFIDAPELVRTLAAVAAIEFVRWDDPNGYKVLLVLNGCQVGCATLPIFDGPCIVATSERVQRRPVQEHELAAVIMDLLKEYAVMDK